MEDIGELKTRLEGEYAALDAAVQRKKAAEQRLLDALEARLERAEERQEQAEGTLARCEGTTQELTERKDRVSERLRSVAGRLWMIRQVTVLFVFLIAGAAADVLLAAWRHGQGIVPQVIALVIGLIFIPRRR